MYISSLSLAYCALDILLDLSAFCCIYFFGILYIVFSFVYSFPCYHLRDGYLLRALLLCAVSVCARMLLDILLLTTLILLNYLVLFCSCQHYCELYFRVNLYFRITCTIYIVVYREAINLPGLQAFVCFKKKICFISLISDMLLIEQLIY